MEGAMIKKKRVCACPVSRTDGGPSCDKYVGHKRPDGFYCDCGHEPWCHP